MAESIRLEQTNTEYLLYIPASQKERAKSIDGRRWDTERICWVYPRTGRVYDELIAEFGDDLINVKVTRPSVKPQEIKSDVQSENISLKKELDGIRELLTSLPKSNDKTVSELQESYNKLALRENEIRALKQQLQEKDNEIHELKRSVIDLKGTMQNLQSQGSSPSCMKYLKSTAIQSSGNNPKFTSLIESMEFNTNKVAIDLAITLDRRLRQVLKVTDNTVTLNDLLAQSRDANLFSLEAMELAHLIRKQRNIIAHGDGYSSTYPAREILALFAASLLWREFPE